MWIRIDGLDELGYRTTHIAPPFSGGVLLNTLCVFYGRIRGKLLYLWIRVTITLEEFNEKTDFL